MAHRHSSERSAVRDEGSVSHSRRSWLIGMLVGPLGGAAWAQRARSIPEQSDADDTAEIAKVQAIGKKAGLEPLAHSRTPYFLGIGDANAAFRKRTLEICEALAPVFVQHFNDKGFKLALPKNRLTVITLKSKESYHAFIGEDAGANVGGHYDLDSNRLVMFDFRPNGEGPALVNDPTRVNLLTLIHEATHLLTFNTGLLSRQSNVPDWVSEGLATYVELWRNKRTRIGDPNALWLSFLSDTRNKGAAWIPIHDLVASDKTFDGETLELSYAESWLTVHFLMKSRELLPKFQAYIAGLSSEEAATNRVAYAEKHLGSLKELERQVDRHFKRGAR